MKTRTMLATALLMAAAALPATAQVGEPTKSEIPYFSDYDSYRNANLTLLRRNYAACLHSDNYGVVESAIAHVVRMKMYLQAEDFSDLKGAIDWLAVSGPTTSIRYKAYLASLVLDNPGWFKEECCKEYTGSNEMFSALAKRLQQTLVGFADRRYVRPE